MLNKRYLVIRLDIDTPLCLKNGVPKLMELASKLGVHFTFFANMGRSISRIEAIKNIAIRNKSKSNCPKPKLSNLRKLGFCGYFSVAVFNKYVGLAYPEILKSLASAGHEVGLHGGQNHAVWQNYAQNWSLQELSAQVDWGARTFYSVMGYKPNIFSSPGWNSPELLADILLQYGFTGMADLFSRSLSDISKENSIHNINTNLVGRPGGVGYFEYCESRGLSELEILEQVKIELNSRNVNVIYDHPYYLASKHYAVLEEIIYYALKSKIEVITMGQLLNTYE